MLALIKTLITTLNLYLKLKNKVFYADLIKRSKNKQRDLIDEIEQLRTDGGSDSTDRADFLFRELVSEKRDLEHLSTIYAPASAGEGSTD